MIKILVADKLSQTGIDWLNEQEDVEVAVHPGLAPDALAEIIGDYDGVIIRSGVQINEAVLAKSGRLKGVARAGVGVDNVDVPLATHRGIIVMNTPDGNTLSTAELAWALILGLSRKIGLANASLRSGEWNRKAFQGTQLANKTLAVVGLGRIGRAVAERGIAMGMRVLGYDPFFAGGQDLGNIEHVKDFDEICKRADYITVHVPKTPETAGMIGAEQFDLMKPSVRLINAARGGIIEPQALLDALNADKVAGAALDVFTSEPPKTEAELALISHDKVLAVPHLGASTAEAQEQVAIDAAVQLVEALRGGEVRNAVNAPGFGQALPESVKPYTELAPRLGGLLSTITPGAIKKVEIIFRGPISEDASTSQIATYVLQGLFQPHMDSPVNVINAPVLAKKRGVEVEIITSPKVREFANLIEVKVTTDKMTRTALGTIFGNKFPRVISIDGYHMEMRPEGNVVIIINEDKPGALGQYGTVFGNHGMNIADLTFSRKKSSGLALVGLNLDQEPTDEVIEEVRSMEQVTDVWSITLPSLPFEFDADEE